MLGREVSNPSRQAQAVTLNAEAIAVLVAAFVEAAKFMKALTGLIEGHCQLRFDCPQFGQPAHDDVHRCQRGRCGTGVAAQRLSQQVDG